MKVREVILRAMAKRITWWQAAEILGITDRSMRRWKRRYELYGNDGLLDRRRGKPSPKRVRLEEAEEVLRLYQERYSDLNVRHFHEKLREAHGIRLGYTWVKLALQGAGLVKKGRKRGVVVRQNCMCLKLIDFALRPSDIHLHAQVPLFDLSFSCLPCEYQGIDAGESCPAAATGSEEAAMSTTPAARG